MDEFNEEINEDSEKEDNEAQEENDFNELSIEKANEFMKGLSILTIENLRFSHTKLF